ncbi:MAG: PKD domain-containing protein, partial [Candidatus Lutacidiplasmatales archaeon]
MNPRRRADTSRSQTRAPTASVVRLTTIATIVLALGASLASGQPVTPSPCPFTVVVTATPSTGASPLVVQLNATVTSGTPTQFDWSFGDGSYWNSSGAGSAAPLHRYAAPGPYQAKVSVVEASCQATGSVTVVTTPSPLSVSVSASSVGGLAPLTVQFSALISGGTATYASAFWSFGDGGVGSGVAVAYTYQRAGSFHVEVNITDSGGHWALASSVVTVRPASAVGPVKLFGIDAWVLEAGVAATIGIAVVAAILRTRARRVAERRSPRAAPTLADPGVAGMPPMTPAPPHPI